jgi:hypothetical protein
MNDELSTTAQQRIGQVRPLFYLLDEPIATLTLQISEQTITVRVYGQVGQDLRALPRGATICATLHDAPPDCPRLIAFTVIPSWA